MNGVQSSLYTAAIALCVFSAGILSDRKSRTGKPSVYFTAFLVLEALGFALELLMVHPASPLKGLWLGLRLGLSLLLAPCLWLAVKEIVEGVRPELALLGRRQAGLIAAGFLLTLPVIERAHWGVTYVNPEQATSVLHSRFIHGTMLACIGIFAWQVPCYLRRCRRMLLEQKERSRPGETGTGWLHFALMIVFSTWAVGLLRTLHCAMIGRRLDFGLWFALAEVSVTVAAIYAVVRRAGASEVAVAEIANIETPASPAAEAKYARSCLPLATRARIKRKIEAAMAAETVYCDSLLNLRTLSAAIKEKAHYVSQVINQDLDSTFYELVNRRRIERAKELLAGSRERTVLEIALAVGFNSKSTFSTAFRRNTGTTPSAFRNAGAASQAGS